MKSDQITIQAAKIFFSAADYIRQYGWRTSGMSTHGKPRCSMGALASAYPKSTWDIGLATTMHEALKGQLEGMTLTQFNYKFNDGNTVAQLYERTAAVLMKSS